MACLVSCRAGPALADARLDALDQQMHDIQAQLATLNSARASLDETRRDEAGKASAMRARLAAQPRVSLDKGRLSVVSADGDFSFALRSVVQFDMGYFAQGRNPPGVDLNSGTNFRRAQIGFTGTAWHDWAYNFTYDFGGNGVEGRGYIYRAYLQYDGLAPVSVRVGAFAPFSGIEDATGGANITFLERAGAANVARGIAGASGREAVSVFAQGANYLASVSFTGGKTTDAATFDEQQAVVGRIAWLALARDRFQWLLNADATHVFKLADVAPGRLSPNTISLGNGPELAVDSVRTIDTGPIPASKVDEFGLESALSAGRFYAQGGWFHYGITRRDPALPDPDFSGWYVQASWSLTGETRLYEPTVAAFRALQPAHPLGTPGGFGAFETKLRYSTVDLDSLAGAASGGIAGGVQTVWSTGLNWYPTTGLRFMLDIDDIHVRHVEDRSRDISAVAIGLRSQISF